MLFTPRPWTALKEEGKQLIKGESVRLNGVVIHGRVGRDVRTLQFGAERRNW